VFLSVSDLTKAYGGERVLDGATFGVVAHETLAVLGRSGCGKTTLMKVIAGLAPPDGGSVVLGGEPLDGLPPEKRGVVYLYQEPLLFPHLDVRGNVGFGLRLRGVPAAERAERVERMLADLELGGQGHKRPGQLSGGQRQRVAFGRALIVQPRLLLLDEPFGNLDAGTRAAMQTLFKRVARRYRITSLLVTHDLKEALVLGDRVALMNAGRLHVYDSPEAFAADPESGVADEVAFWSRLGNPPLDP
jgi:ABC-type Fe3+/spermidine/putrescine transport system ATPase subunit